MTVAAVAVVGFTEFLLKLLSSTDSVLILFVKVSTVLIGLSSSVLGSMPETEIDPLPDVVVIGFTEILLVLLSAAVCLLSAGFLLSGSTGTIVVVAVVVVVL